MNRQNNIHNFAEQITPVIETFICSYIGRIVDDDLIDEMISNASNIILFKHSISFNEMYQPVIMVEHENGFVAFALVADEI